MKSADVATPVATPDPRDASIDWTRTLLDALDDAVFVHDCEGRIVEVNAAACRRLGYTRSEILRLTTREIDAPDFAQGFNERTATQLTQGTFRFEGLHRAKGGRLIPVDINTSRITLHGRPAILAVIRDISERKQAEEAHAKQGRLLQLILDNLGDAIVAADVDGQVFLFNPAAERLFGPHLVQHDYQVFASDHGAPSPPLLGRCIAGASFDDEEWFIRQPDAPDGLWMRVNGRPLRDAHGALRGGVLVGHDVTKRRTVERRLQAQNAVSQALASGALLEAISSTILQALCEGLEMEFAVLWVFDGRDQVLHCTEMFSRLPGDPRELRAFTRRLKLAAGVEAPGQVCQHGNPVVMTLGEWDTRRSPRHQLAWHEGLRGAAAFPIFSQQAVVGVLEFFGRTVHHVDDGLRASMAAIGSQIGQLLERQRVERALRDSEALYQSLVQSLPQNIFRKDRAGRVTFGNQRYCETLGIPLDELLGKTDFDLFPVELARKYTLDDQEVLAGRPFETVEQHHLPDGADIFVQVIKTPVYDAQGNIVGTQGMFWDVTEKKHAAEAIAASERRYRQLTEATLDAIVLVDQHEKITLFNPAAERMFGWKADEVIGQSTTLLVPDAYQPLHLQGFRRFVATRQPRMIGRTVEVQARRKDGAEFPVEIALSALSLSADPHGPIQFLAAIRDLTERNKMRAVLVQSEKLASIGLLSAGVAHEINNPLAFIANNLAVLDRDCLGLLPLLTLIEKQGAELARLTPEMWQRFEAIAHEIDLPYIQENLGRLLQRTRDGVDRVTRIVHSLRGLARTDTPRNQDVALADLVDASLEILRGRFRRSGIVVEQEHAEGIKVPCVPTQISQVILNLLVNAFQAVEAHRTEGGRVWIRSRRDGDEMLLEIADNGPGIDPTHFPKLFDPFFTTKEVGEGTGLGLSISHNIVMAHGGRVEVHGAFGQGATFRVYLPLQPSRG